MVERRRACLEEAVAAVARVVPIILLCAALCAAGAAAGCASATGAVPRPFPMRDTISNADGSPTSADAALITSALEFRGVPYRDGGSDPSGFDCSGFTQYVFSRNGLTLPREVRDQFKVGKAVDANDVAPGDLIFFSTTAPGASHVAIAIGPDAFVHAPSSNGVVRVERLSSEYWSKRYVGARRVTQP
jgi:cell wall-associated NlpC family hydrolase